MSLILVLDRIINKTKGVKKLWVLLVLESSSRHNFATPDVYNFNNLYVTHIGTSNMYTDYVKILGKKHNTGLPLQVLKSGLRD